MNCFHLPNLSLSLLEAIAHNECHNAEYPIFRYDDADGKVRSINWGEAGKAFDVAAAIVQRDIGAQSLSEMDIVVGILANLDSVSFYCLLVGIMRAGFIPFPISPRNAPEAVANLLAITNCSVVVSSGDVAVQTLLQSSTRIFEDTAKKSLKNVAAPTFGQLFGSGASGIDTSRVRKIPERHQSLAECAGNICVISHSSGTTSLPKPIYLDNLMIYQFGTRDRHEQNSTFRYSNLAAHAIPMFHIMGFILIPWSVFSGLTLCILRPREPPILPSPDVVLHGAITTSASVVYCAPTFLEAWANDGANVEPMKNFKMILYGGGPVQDDVAVLLSAEGVKLRPILGLTETGVLTTFYPQHITNEGPGWYEADPLLDIVYIPEDEINSEGVYRLGLRANSIRKPVSFDTVTDGTPTYDTKDLVMFHPQNPHIWKIIGRADDQITHSTGEKTNPVPIETQLQKSPYIASAIMFGRARMQPGVLITPHEDFVFDTTDSATRRYDEYLDLIWDTVTAANATSPRHSRIFKEMILIANPAKPFEYTSKGTIRRQATLDKYQAEIAQLYNVVEAPGSHETTHPRSLEPSTVLDVIRSIVERVLERAVEDNEDVFCLGADSLCALSIRVETTRWLQSMVGKMAIEKIPRDLLYVYPSVSALTGYITGPFIKAMNEMHLDTVKQYTLQFSLEEDIKWQAALQSKETVIEIVPSKGEPPLIIIHAGGGNIDPFLPFMKCTSAVWAIKMGEDVPKGSTETIVDFYYIKIKEKQPNGPYRLASYSGSSVYLIALVRLFESRGNEVEQMVMLDHCPGLFFPEFRPEVVKPEDPVWMKQYLDDNIRIIANLMIPAITVRARLLSDVLLVKRNEELISTLNGGKTAPPHIAHFAAMVTVMQDTSLRYLMNDVFMETDAEGKRLWSFTRFRQIMDAIKAPLTIYVASDGSVIAIPKDYPQAKKDLGASMFFSNFTIVPIDGDHISFLEDVELHRHIEGKYRRDS